MTPESFRLNLLLIIAIISTLFWIFYAGLQQFGFNLEAVLLVATLGAANLVNWAHEHSGEHSVPSLELKPDGISYKRYSGPIPGLNLQWSMLKKVEVLPTRRFRPDRVIFYFENRFQISIDWDYIHGVPDLPSLFISIKTWAPQALIQAPEIAQRSESTSYTELWLDSNSIPENRLIKSQLLPIGTILNERFHVLNVLSGGGQGTTYIAADGTAHESASVVVKEYILPNRASTLRTICVSKLDKEVEILRRIDYPLIVKVIDFFVEDSRAYIVMEYIEGTTLKDLVTNQGKQNEKRVIEFGIQICKIAHHLHSMTPPIVHGDLTPDNLILTLDGGIKVIHFDVAQEIMSTVSRTVVGKNAYMSPEQFKGQINTKSDVYAIGCSLFYLLTGEEPVPLTVSHPRELVEDVSEELDLLVAEVTQADPNSRTTAGILQAKLEQLSRRSQS
ncbi:MAG TPA: serine/threonine-protein kinase [Drouetiella sp.]|jgi:predicted Ser/Thr protein kinase